MAIFFTFWSSLVIFCELIIPFAVCNLLKSDKDIVCTKVPLSIGCGIKHRRYGIGHMGRNGYFHGWADVQGQGAANDYCRIVGSNDRLVLTCTLAGSIVENDAYYNSSAGFDPGFTNTWYMKDEDGDGRDDYCRCASKGQATYIICTKAGPFGFYGSKAQPGDEYTFLLTGPTNCKDVNLHPQFGKPWTSV